MDYKRSFLPLEETIQTILYYCGILIIDQHSKIRIRELHGSELIRTFKSLLIDLKFNHVFNISHDDHKDIHYAQYIGDKQGDKAHSIDKVRSCLFLICASRML